MVSVDSVVGGYDVSVERVAVVEYVGTTLDDALSDAESDRDVVVSVAVVVGVELSVADVSPV